MKTPILEYQGDPLYEIPIKGHIQLEFEGRSPLQPGRHRVQENGAIGSVPVVPFLWDVVASCRRLSQASPSREVVRVMTTEYSLEFERDGDVVVVRLVATDEPGAPALAETRVGTQELNKEIAEAASVVLGRIRVLNPETRGNLPLKGLADSIEALSKSVVG